MGKHWFTAYLTSQYSKGKTLGLDLGCGRRNWKEFWKCESIGLDLPSTLKNEIGKRPEICGTSISLPFNDNSFDFLSCYSVLSYVEHVDSALNEIYRVLKPNGIAIIIVVNPRGMEQHKEILWINRFNSKKLHEKLYSHGFKSIKHRNLKSWIFSIYYNLTSVYAYEIVKIRKNTGN